jgi:hypothetical protein
MPALQRKALVTSHRKRNMQQLRLLAQVSVTTSTVLSLRRSLIVVPTPSPLVHWLPSSASDAVPFSGTRHHLSASRTMAPLPGDVPGLCLRCSLRVRVRRCFATMCRPSCSVAAALGEYRRLQRAAAAHQLPATVLVSFLH